VWIGLERDEAEDPGRIPRTLSPSCAVSAPSRNPPDPLQAYLDPLPVRNIQGFGSAVVATLRTAFPSLLEGPTIHDLRMTASHAAFRRLLPASQASTLWHLLHGRDDAPVKPSARWPGQISVEDSSASDLWRTLSVIRIQALTLLEKLIERMEEELTYGADEPYADGITFRPRPPVRGDAKWMRYPSRLRLTIRTYTSTQSKSAAMPAFVFDTATARHDRAKRIMTSLVDRMIKGMLGKGRSGSGEPEFEVYV
jgi:nucleotidyltransferase/DNA polymerase involved in DNA repair